MSRNIQETLSAYTAADTPVEVTGRSLHELPVSGPEIQPDATAAPLGLVLFAHSSFDSPFIVGSHHLRRIFAQRSDVCFLGVNPFIGLAARARRKASGTGTVTPLSLLPLRLPQPLAREYILRFNTWLAWVSLRKQLASFPQARVAIFDNPYALGFARSLRGAGFKIVVRLTDWMPGQLETPDRETNFRLLRQAVRQADRVITTSAPIARCVTRMGGSKPIVITNGVDDIFLAPNARSSAPAQRVIYYGSLDRRIDAAMLVEVARLCSSMDFHIHSPDTPSFSSDRLPPNLHLSGPIAYEELPSRLTAFDYALLPFSNNAANHGRFPMKLFEMLGSGLQVVTPPLASLRGIPPTPGLHCAPSFFASDMAVTLAAVDRRWRASSPEERRAHLALQRERAAGETWTSKAEQILLLCRSLTSSS